MARIVMKFGGTSVGDIDRIKRAAGKVKREVDAGNDVAVVVSAMSGETNRLIGLTQEMSQLHDAREYDVVVSTGEQVTIGLMAMALQELGVNARSWTGWQLPVVTSDAHSAARIESIDCDEIISRFDENQVAVVPGFQGVSHLNRVTTLGRGGSDTSAVALAAALKADRCDIYTDVDGVYTTDPRIVPAARKMDRITYEEMLELASLGAKVLQTRSVELAMNHNVRVQVRSSFNDEPGTMVVNEEEIVEQQTVSGVTCNTSEAKVTLRHVQDQPGVAAAIFGPLAAGGINVDMIVQNVSEDGATTDMTFTCGRDQLDRCMQILADHRDTGFVCKDISSDADVAKVSIVGVGMRSHTGVAQTMFTALADKGINIQVITTSEIKVSVLIGADYNELAVRALHTAFGLDAPA